MITGAHQKVTASHLKRDAYLYVRQSTLRQVFENTESTRRQYALRDRAVALGWPVERVVVIDSDLGKSGASAVDRAGFKKLVAEVGVGHVGIVLGLEVSRLARNSTDWHRLLEICALTDTLILDEDGIYDPSHFNDRLLLGLKGTMSEAELHMLRARLRGGMLNKAKRGELKSPLPVGFVYTPDDRVVLDPDQQVQKAIRLLFSTFRRTGSAWSTMKAFREQGLEFPRRVRKGPHKDQLLWGSLMNQRVLQILHNPRYAGAFFYGRTHTRKTADGKHHIEQLPQEEWFALIPDAHPGYISWDQYQENLRRLQENAQAYGSQRRRSPPREGPALLQGLVLCGICGRRMTVRYHTRQKRSVPEYRCQRDCVDKGEKVCQYIIGKSIDEIIGELLIEAVTPMALEVALTVQQELTDRAEEADRLRRKQVERARYEADLAQRRYLQVDPDNRMVADVLEADWNQKLRDLDKTQEEYERQSRADHLVLDEEKRREILALATDFPRLWRDPKTPDRERKRMVRLILEDVTLIKGKEITMHVRFKGGAVRTLTLPLPLPIWELHRTDSKIVEEIDRLIDHHTYAEIADLLNKRGRRSCEDRPFRTNIIRKIQHTHHLTDRFTRLRAAGMLTQEEMAERLGVVTATVKNWRRSGLLRCHAYNDKSQYLYEPPDNSIPGKYARKAPYIQKMESCAESAQRGAV